MDAIRAGRAGDLLVTFVPTQAHLHSPSLIEINFAENILAGLRQAVDFVGRNVQSPYLKRGIDVLITSMEFHSIFLSDSCATVGERYMGLRRVSTTSSSSLNRIQKIITLLDAVIVPYLMSLPEDAPGSSERVRELVIKLKMLKSIFSIMYLLNITKYSSPTNFLARVVITRNLDPPSPDRSRIWKDRLKNLPSMLVWSLVYGVQFVQWYYAHQDVLRPSRKNLSQIPPPPVVPSGLADYRLCPICRAPRKNPTALLDNGRVYCFTCIAGTMEPENVPILTRRLVE
jgi:hypothetical protein